MKIRIIISLLMVLGLGWVGGWGEIEASQNKRANFQINDNWIDWGDWEAPVLGEEFWWEEEKVGDVKRTESGNEIRDGGENENDNESVTKKPCGSAVNVDSLSPSWSLATDNREEELIYRTWVDGDQNLSRAKEEGWHNFSLEVSDNSQNATVGTDLCPIMIDRTVPISRISGNEPLIASEAAEINYLVTDESGLLEKIELYYRWQDKNENWEGDFELIGQKEIKRPEQAMGSFSLQKSFLKGSGYYQFAAISVDQAGNRENWPAETATLPVTFWETPIIKNEQAKVTFENELGKFNYSRSLQLQNLDFSGLVIDSQELERLREFTSNSEEFPEYYWLVNESMGAKVVTGTDHGVSPVVGEKMLKLENLVAADQYNGFELPQAVYHLGKLRYQPVNTFHTLSLKYNLQSETKLPGIHEAILNIEMCGVEVAQLGAGQLGEKNEQGWYESGWQELKLNGLHCQHENYQSGDFIFNLGSNLGTEEKFRVYLDDISFERSRLNPETTIRIESQEPTWPQVTYEYWQAGELHSFQASQAAEFKLAQTPDNNLVNYYLGNEENPRLAQEQLWVEIDQESPELKEATFETRSDLRAGIDQTWRWDFFVHFLTGDNFVNQPLIYRIEYFMASELETMRPEETYDLGIRKLFAQKTSYQSLDRIWKSPSLFGDQNGEDYYGYRASPSFKTYSDYAWVQVYDQALNSDPEKAGLLINLKTGEEESYDEKF